MHRVLPTPETTLAVLFGASEFPKQAQLTPSKAFFRSASELREYFLSPKGLALPTENVLDLFDSPKSSDAIDEELVLFLDRRQSDLKTRQLAVRDVIVYYVGHGGFSSPGNSYFLALRTTRAGNELMSSYAITSLANTLREHASFSRKYLILDSCFSAAAQASFQSAPLEVAKQQTLEEFPDKGTALLCAAGPKDPARSLPDQQYTMFSGALLHVLQRGASEKPHKLSLADIGELTTSLIKEQFPDKAVRPEVHSPDQKQGNVVVLPFFPNPAKENEIERLRERVLSEDAAKAIVTERNLYSVDWNKNGTGIKHNYTVVDERGERLILDRATGLIWQRGGSPERMQLVRAKQYIQTLNELKYVNHEDWRLPTLEEAMSLMEPTKKPLYINPVFDNRLFWIWTADMSNEKSAWMTNYRLGSCAYYGIDSEFFVRAVR